MSNREMSFFRTPLYKQIRNHLAAEIAAGIYPVGKPLPTEVDLARELKVSEGTVRKALDQLEAEFVLSRKQGRGTFVKANEPAQPCPHCEGTGRVLPEEQAA